MKSLINVSCHYYHFMFFLSPGPWALIAGVTHHPGSGYGSTSKEVWGTEKGMGSGLDENRYYSVFILYSYDKGCSWLRV